MADREGRLAGRHPGSMEAFDVWRIAIRCAGAGAGYVLASRGEPDTPIPHEVFPVVAGILAEFGFEPPPDAAAYFAEFET